MTRLFVSDIDGCLSDPYRPYDRARLDAIARIAADGDPARVPHTPPGVSICTGRPYPYTEAMTQALGLRLPVLFEAGAGLFDPRAARVRWHPAFDADAARQVDDVRRWMETLVADTPLIVDIGKRTQAGVIGPDPEAVQAILPRIRERVESDFPALTVAWTPISIDVMSRRLTKESGLHWLAEELDVPLADMAFIGDTGGDLGALRLVGRSFAPANAAAEVRAAVGFVTKGRVAEGVLEALLACIRLNGEA